VGEQHKARHGGSWGDGITASGGKGISYNDISKGGTYTLNIGKGRRSLGVIVREEELSSYFAIFYERKGRVRGHFGEDVGKGKKVTFVSFRGIKKRAAESGAFLSRRQRRW